MTENTPTPAQHLVAQLRRAAEAIEDHEGDALGDDPRAFDEWIMLSDAAKAIERLVAVTAERDALAATVDLVRAWADTPLDQEGGGWIDLDRILSTAPTTVLAQVKADAWHEGYAACVWAVADRQVVRNPYRIEREAR